MNKDISIIKISDIIINQIPEFINSENPNFAEFLKQYYISQEFQGGNIDLSENLIQYKNTDSFDSNNLIEYTQLTSDVDYSDDIINVKSTNGWPDQYGLIKIKDEIITYTGITTNSFTGCIRGFSGTSSLQQENNPEFLVFEKSSTDAHTTSSIVYNLSNLFLQEFFKKIKSQFSPGFEQFEFDSNINKQNFISNVNDFYSSKGTNIAFDILFKVLYNKNISIITPKDFCFTSSDDEWISTLTLFVELISGDPNLVQGQSLIQDKFDNILPAIGSIYKIEPVNLKENNFYRIYIFSGYNNNKNPSKSIFGEFIPTNKTYTTEKISQQSSIITVDSTIGFNNSGKLNIGNLIITYTEKTNTQFINCSGITSIIEPGTEVFSDNYVYSYENENENIVKFRILNTISELKDNDITYSLPGDGFKVDNFGKVEETLFTKSLIYNLPLTIYTGKVVEEFSEYTQDAINYTTNQVRTKYSHRLYENDTIDLYNYNTNQFLGRFQCYLTGESNLFNLSASSLNLSEIKSYTKFKRILLKASSDNYPEINEYVCDIQNSFEDEKFYYINSNGFPKFNINPYKRKFTFITNQNDYTLLSTSSNHNFDNGDLINISSFEVNGTFKNVIGISTEISLYVKKVSDNTLRLAYSNENIENSRFINFSELINPPLNNNISGYISSLELVDWDISRNLSKLSSSKILNKIPKYPYFSPEPQITPNGPIAILTNGVQIQNYKSFDSIFYGKIKNIIVSNPGNNYNLLNPPKLYVDQDTVLIPQLSGKLKDIKVLDPGYDYVETPFVKILGGGIEGEYVEVRMKLNYKKNLLDSSPTGGSIDLTNNLFVFEYPHKFLTGESVIYRSGKSKQIEVESNQYLINESVYYIINVGAGTSFKIAYNKKNALLGNEINLQSYGKGYHSFESTSGKYCIDSLVSNNNITFKYKKLSFNSNEINSYDNIFTKNNHEFAENDEILYSIINGNALSGITTTNYYYIHKIDNNRFKLKFEKESNNFVNFGEAQPNSCHAIELSPIRLKIEGKLTKSGISINGYDAILSPTVLGSVDDIILARTNNNYGYVNSQNTNIINYNKCPKVNVISGKNANLTPIISNGKINQVIIKNGGTNYYNEIELTVIGIGTGAIIHPVIVNGSIVSTTIFNSGVGYDNSTRILVNELGTGLNVYSEIQSWKLNEVSKFGVTNLQNGILLGKKYSLYDNIFRVYFITNDLIEYYKIPILNNNEIPTKHSSIIGWSYDGCPIYGPDGYSNPTKISSIKRLKSSYIKNTISQISAFDIIEDYQYKDGVGDLDKHNGRFCITPEYPNGIYAYFCTMENNGDPVFPYIIGNSYKFTSPQENFDLNYSQNLNSNELDIIKHTSPYRIEDKDHYYEYFQLYSNKEYNDIIVKESSIGNLSNIDVIDGGSGYKIGDTLNFDNSNTNGFGAIAKISKISGVGVSSVSSNYKKINDITIISENNYIVGIASTYHGFANNSYINVSEISTNLQNNLQGLKIVEVENYSSKLSHVLQNSNITGITTSIKISGTISKFEIDSYINIRNVEICKIIGLDYINNLIEIIRISGSPESPVGSLVELLPNKFKFKDYDSTNFKYKNSSYYFTPNKSVSIGTNVLVGAGNTLTIPVNNGINYTKYTETGGIYLPNHEFKSGDSVIYSYEGSTPIVTNQGNLNSLPNLYVIELEKDVIGLVTQLNYISDKSNRLLFTSASSVQLAKFKTQRNITTVSASFNDIIVNTINPHNLSKDDEISLKVISGITTTLAVSYNQNTTRLEINSSNNPEIQFYRNSIINFDLSSASLINSKFKIYVDDKFINEYVSNNLIKSEDGLTLSLKIDEETPNILYYNLDSSIIKIYPDESVLNFNRIVLRDSLYNGSGKIIAKTNTSFTVNYQNPTEKLSYNQSEAIMSYDISKSDSFGPISKIDIISNGKNYNKLPIIKGVSSSGSGAKLFPTSYNIGKIKKTSVVNQELVVPSDKTIKPFANIYSSLLLSSNFKVNSVNIAYGGDQYLNPPIVKLYDIKNKKLVSNFSALAVLKNTSVEHIEIIDPANGIELDQTKIIFTENSNGIRILNVGIAGTEVTLTLQTPDTGFDIYNPLPFSVGDDIFVENIMTYFGNGINSKDYDYEYFKVISANSGNGNQNAATIRYYVKNTVGVFGIDEKSSVSNAKHIPKVVLNIDKNSFYSGESISDTNIIENFKNFDGINIINVNNSSNIKEGQIVAGKSSNSKAKVYKIQKYTSNIDTVSGYINNLGWNSKKGNLSDSIQKLQDNDYYQNFSYSIKSPCQITNWNASVSELCHISGFKNFSDLMVESFTTGISTIKTDTESLVNLKIESIIDENSHFDYDLVSENVDDHPTFSNIVKFKTKKLSSYILSKENRVLSIDDISGLFDTKFPIDVTIPIDKISSEDGIAVKYIFLIQSSDSFFGDYVYPSLFELYLTRNNDIIELTSYAHNPYDTFGTIFAEISSNDNTVIELNFSPKEPLRSYLIRAVRETFSNTVGIITTSYGFLKNMQITEYYPAEISPTTKILYSIPVSDVGSGSFFVGISSSLYSIESHKESAFLIDNQNLYVNVYTENSPKNIGEVAAQILGNNLVISYTGISGIGVTVYSNINVLTNTLISPNEVVDNFTRLNSNIVNYTGNSPFIISNVSSSYGGSKYSLEVTKDNGVTVERGFAQIDIVHYNNELYLSHVNYSIIGDFDNLNFQTSYNITNDEYILTYIPDENSNYTIKFFEKNISKLIT